jgi:DNA-binding NarL/FixJ family response regulator
MAQPHQSLSGVRLLFADDNRGLQHSFVPVLEQAGLVVTMCFSGPALQQMLAHCADDFDVVVTDLWDMGTAESRFIPERDIPALVRAYPRLPFLILSSESYQVQQYEDAGVRGYVLKVDTVQGLRQALHAVLVEGREMVYSQSVELRYRLSRRERQVLTAMAQGLTDKEIAERLTISIKSARTYRQRLYDKFRTPDDPAINAAKVVARALHEGLIATANLADEPHEPDASDDPTRKNGS